MKVLFVHNRYRVRGGEDEVVDREIALLRNGGLQLELLTADSKDLKSPISKLQTAVQLPYSRNSFKLLQNRLESFQPDLVHVHNFFPTFTPSIYDACFEMKVPVVQTLHNFRIFCASALLAREGKPCELCLGKSSAPAVRYACYQGSRLGSLALSRMIERHKTQDTWNRKVSTFIALSEFSKSKFVVGGLAKEKITIKPNFAFRPQSSPPQLESRENAALYVGRLSAEKGAGTLIQAWKNIDYPLWVAGDGPLANELAAESRPNVVFLGRQSQEQISDLMRRARFLVLPSECYENFPLVIAEAFSHGLPVIASRIGSLIEIIEDRKNGVHFIPGDRNSLHQAVLEIASDTTLQQAISQRAHEDYLRLYTPEANFRMLTDIYEKAKSQTL